MVYLYGIYIAIMVKFFDNIVIITNGKTINLHVILIDIIFKLQNPSLIINRNKINKIVLE